MIIKFVLYDLQINFNKLQRVRRIHMYGHHVSKTDNCYLTEVHVVVSNDSNYWQAMRYNDTKFMVSVN